MPEVIVRGEALVKSYPDGRGVRTVVDGVDVEVEAGRIVAVLGRSGCGKTTLLNMVSGLLRPDGGRVLLAGTALDYSRPKDVARARRAHIGLISQSYGLIDEESVRENIALPLSFGRPRPPRQARHTLVEEAMVRAALEVSPKAKVATLSGGEKQRVAIARALVRQPTLLVADEPTAALDSVTGSAITSLLRALAQSGVGVLVATHDEQVVQACDTVYRFDDAGLRQTTPAEVR